MQLFKQNHQLNQVPQDWSHTSGTGPSDKGTRKTIFLGPVLAKKFLKFKLFILLGPGPRKDIFRIKIIYFAWTGPNCQNDFSFRAFWSLYFLV